MKLTSKQMRKIYWKKRKNGYSHSYSFNTTGKLQYNIRKYGLNAIPKNLRKGSQAYLDYDGDGKVNKYDCKPLNYKKQDNFLKKLALGAGERIASKLGFEDKALEWGTKKDNYIADDVIRKDIKERAKEAWREKLKEDRDLSKQVIKIGKRNEWERKKRRNEEIAIKEIRKENPGTSEEQALRKLYFGGKEDIARMIKQGEKYRLKAIRRQHGKKKNKDKELIKLNENEEMKKGTPYQTYFRDKKTGEIIYLPL